MIQNLFSVFFPLLLHMVISELVPVAVNGALGAGWDSTALTSLVSALVIPAALAMYRRDSRMKERKAEAVRERSWRPAIFVLCFVSGGMLNLAWSGILSLSGIQQHFSNAVQEALLASDITLQFLGLGLLVPAAEELIFRGLVYSRMKRFLGVPAAVFFSALLFAVYHGNIIQMVFAFPMAVVLALFFEKTGWFGSPLAFHMGANVTAVVMNLIIA